MAVLRDHGTGGPAPRLLAAHRRHGRAVHARRRAGRRVADDGVVGGGARTRRRRPHWVTATAAPCTGLFKPVPRRPSRSTSAPSRPTGSTTGALWWRHELLHRRVHDRPRAASSRGSPASATRSKRAGWPTRPSRPLRSPRPTGCSSAGPRDARQARDRHAGRCGPGATGGPVTAGPACPDGPRPRDPHGARDPHDPHSGRDQPYPTSARDDRRVRRPREPRQGGRLRGARASTW